MSVAPTPLWAKRGVLGLDPNKLVNGFFGIPSSGSRWENKI